MANITPRPGKNGTSYQIRVSVGYDAKGKQLFRSMTWRPDPGMTQKQIEKELKRQAVLFEEQCAGAGMVSGNIKFEELARQWIAEVAEKKDRALTTARLHQFEDRTYTALGHLRVDRMTHRHVQAFVDNLSEEGVGRKRDYARPLVDFLELLAKREMDQKVLAVKSGVSRSSISTMCRGERVLLENAEKVSAALGCKLTALFEVQKGDGRLSRKTIGLYLSFVSAVLDYAFHLGMIRENPCKRVILPAGEMTEREVYTLEEAQRFLESLEIAPVKYKAFFILAIYGGLRRGELLGLEWSDIDFQSQTVKIVRTSQYLKDRGTFTDTTKTKQSQRTLKLPVVVFDILRKLHSEHLQNRLMAGREWNPSDRLFVQDNGDPLHPNTPYSWCRKHCKRTGQRFLGVHVFRHLNASLLINSGVDVRTVSASLGHSQTTTTLNIYAHSFQEAQAQASEAVADLLAAPRKKGAG